MSDFSPLWILPAMDNTQAGQRAIDNEKMDGANVPKPFLLNADTFY